MHNPSILPDSNLAAADETLIAQHLENMRQWGMSARTMEQRRRSLRRMIPVLPVPLIEATAAMLAEWRAGLTCGEEAIKHYVGDARAFYRWAVDTGLIMDNPADKLPVPRVGRRLPRPISEDDLYAALATAPPRIRPWLVLAGWAGLRAKEIARLRRQHVLDTARPPVLIVVHDATKGRSERIVPLSGFVLGELYRHGLPGHGWVFPRGDGQSRPNTPHLVSTLCNRYLHECGIQATLHQLRHRFGTMTYRVSRDLRVVQELMGHADPRTTAGYAAFDQADAAAAVAALPQPPALSTPGPPPAAGTGSGT